MDDGFNPKSGGLYSTVGAIGLILLSTFLIGLSLLGFFVVSRAEQGMVAASAFSTVGALENAVKAIRPGNLSSLSDVTSGFISDSVAYIHIIDARHRIRVRSPANAGGPDIVNDPRLDMRIQGDAPPIVKTTSADGIEVFDVIVMGRRGFGPGRPRRGHFRWPSISDDAESDEEKDWDGDRPAPPRGPLAVQIGIRTSETAWLWNWAKAQALATAVVVIVLWMAWFFGRRNSLALALAAVANRKREVFARLGEVSAVLAHEIRNPLASLKGHVQLAHEALSTGADPDRVVARLDTVLDEVLSVESLVRGLLDYAKGREFRPVATSADVIFERALALARSADRWADTPVKSNIESGIFVFVDPEPMAQALSNLILNAGESAGPTGMIETGAVLRKGEVMIFVDDSGPGIDPTVFSRIFDPFVTTKARGVGLGLAVTRQVVEAHDGTISADKSPSLGGARFVMTLPACKG